MFTRRHEQELAEIRTLTYELDQRVREALEQIKRIQNAYGFMRAQPKLAAQDQRMGGSSESVHEGIREEIDALATRYELADGAADALQGLVRLVDWGQANFVPRSDPSASAGDRRGLRAPSRRTALNLLAESLSGLELEAVRAARRVADIGSGAGFPGLVLAIALPQARLALIEKVPERCRFLRRAAAELGLDNVEVVEGTAQEWSEGAGACDVVTSRKVGRLKTMVEWSAPLLARGGAVALWPGTTDFTEEEPAAAADAADAAGLRLAQVLPLESENRRGKTVVKHLYLYEKVDES